MEERIQAILKERFGRDLDNCTKSEIFEALMHAKYHGDQEQPG